jgi:hypothetical protein
VSQPARTATAQMETSYHQFIIEDWNSEGFTDPRVAASNGLVGAELGRAVVLVGISVGPVNVTVELFEEPAESVDLTDWDDIVDISLRSRNGHLVARGIESNPPQELPELSHAGPGTYRLRVHARGRDTAVDLATFDPVEDYKVSIWPAPVAPELVHKQSDNYGAGIRRNWKS